MAGHIVGDDGELVVKLRMQRAILERVGDDIAAKMHELAAADPGQRWRSDAQRAYLRSLADVREGLHVAWAALDAAIGEVDGDLTAVLGGGAR